MRGREGSAAYLVPRRTIWFVMAAVILSSGSALSLVVRTHAELLPQDVLLLEIATGLLFLTILSVSVIPIRLRVLQRRLQRTLEKLESGTLSAAENPLGTLGVAFQEHYRLLWRSNMLYRGSIEVHHALIRNLISLVDAGCIILDGRGEVRYRSEAAAALGNDGEAFGTAVTPSVSEILSVLAAGDQIETVTVAGASYRCYPIYGPVLLGKNDQGGAMLHSRDGLAFVLLTDRPLKNAVSRSADDSVARIQRGKSGILRTLEQLFSRS